MVSTIKKFNVPNVGVKEIKDMRNCLMCKKQFHKSEVTFITKDEYNPDGYFICHGCMPKFLEITG